MVVFIFALNESEETATEWVEKIIQQKRKQHENWKRLLLDAYYSFNKYTCLCMCFASAATERTTI